MRRSLKVLGSKCFSLLVATAITGLIYGQTNSSDSTGRTPESLRPPADGEAVWFGEDEPPLLIQPGQMADACGPDGPPAATPLPQMHWGTAPQRGPWHWQSLPEGLVFSSYLADGKESRLGSVWSYESDHGWLWDAALGGRFGLIRYGDENPALPHGWQLDVEGAAFPRLNLDSQRQMMATDFRVGVPLTLRYGLFESKFGYYHLSSHLGDDFILENPAATPVNYVRESVVWAVGLRPIENMRLYAEADYSFYTKGGAEPWQFQFGAEWSRVRPQPGLGSPFFAVHGQLRQEADFGGNLTAQTGWQWRGRRGNLLRVGFHYFNGKSIAYQFFDEHEEHFGLGVWYDF